MMKRTNFIANRTFAGRAYPHVAKGYAYGNHKGYVGSIRILHQWDESAILTSIDRLCGWKCSGRPKVPTPKTL